MLGSQQNRPKFRVNSPALAWLREFKTAESGQGPESFELSQELQSAHPWLWNPTWGKDDSSNEGMRALKSEVRRVDAMALALEDFLQCIRDRQVHLREYQDENSRKLQFSRLSDDVLAIIFEFASSPEGHEVTDDHIYYMTPILLSRVSRRFRCIALSMPHLWSPPVLDSGMQDLDAAKLILARDSKDDTLISAHMRSPTRPGWDSEDSETHFTIFFDFIISLSSRLSSLHFHFCCETDKHLVKRLTESLTALQLPSLRTLELGFDDVPSESMARIANDIWGKWEMPLFDTLHLRNVIPGPRLNVSILIRITNCSITFGDRDPPGSGKVPGWQKRGVNPIMEFMNKLSAVRALRVEIYGNAKDVFGKEKQTSFRVSLPYVQCLSVTAYGLGLEANPFWRAFRAPVVTSWNVGFDVPARSFNNAMPEDHARLEGRLTNIFVGKFYPTLQELGFTVRYNDAVKVVDHASLISFFLDNSKGEFHILENVENVSFTFPGVKRVSGAGRGDAKFRPVHLKNCKGMLGEVMTQIESRMFEPGGAHLWPIEVDGDDVRKLGWTRWNEISADPKAS